MKKFEVDNVNCANCANLIKNALRADFGEVEVDFSTKPAILSLELSDDKIENLKEALSDLNFPILRAL
ncbi:heavy-metal-associated domain protein, putative copper metallochaperone CopZ [Campylobacter avium LMG 24591]|uniref:Heavy-metal-associated domain protein, putative copper metallochaperone CopZ n=1 Tax=Campylobacter avium LMG 24591 TaxID=522484 RepID=A0A222MWG2_9BACT|nr:heavy-metal-associated domain-containing protein [Campylobacter avium]ASQ29998.1 heavy-metal-associated domain protein, putative copper metallochaperone CopZ [Campylobacter avium LMG 24591]OYD79097.1 heavy-metal-associated domain protein, putative copper metallochaperone CopZ [Campylobacter avium]